MSGWKGQGQLDEEQALRAAMAASAQSDVDTRAAAEAEAVEMELAMAASRLQVRRWSGALYVLRSKQRSLVRSTF